MVEDSSVKKSIQSQFLAGLGMLGETIQKCPDEVWLDHSREPGFWQVAYHTLFYLHLYLQPSAQEFQPWSKHQEYFETLGSLPWPPYDKPEIEEPLTNADVMEYLEFCCQEVRRIVPELELSGGSGFEWLPMSKMELQLYNIRHLMQHTGELSERLKVQTGLEITWRGMEA